MTHTSEWPMKVQPGLTDTELMLFLKERLQNFHQTNLVLSRPATSRDFPPQAEYSYHYQADSRYSSQLA